MQLDRDTRSLNRVMTFQDSLMDTYTTTRTHASGYTEHDVPHTTVTLTKEYIHRQSKYGFSSQLLILLKNAYIIFVVLFTIFSSKKVPRSNIFDILCSHSTKYSSVVSRYFVRL